MLGLFIAFVGVLSLFAAQLSTPDRTGLLGDAILLFSAMVLGVKFTYVKKVLHRVAVPTVVLWEATLAVPMFLVCGWLMESFSPAKLDSTTLLAIGYQGLAVSAVAFLIWMKLLSKHSPNDLAAISFTTPLFGMLAGWVMLGEPLTFSLLVGGCLITLGIYCINAR
ncbi:MAG: DMT family transporter [Planctomycetota bacterium]